MKAMESLNIPRYTEKSIPIVIIADEFPNNFSFHKVSLSYLISCSMSVYVFSTTPSVT